MAMNLSAVMEAIANTLIEDVHTRTYSWPIENPTVPCMVVAYPEIDFDFTFDRGSDRAEFPVYYVAGKVSDRNTRDELSNIITGANGVKEALSGTLGGVVQSADVTRCAITEITFNGTAYAAAEFTVDIIT